jgi:hypothetical protein
MFPEFNDCQRLVLGTGETAAYDSLYAVFAHDSLDDTLYIRNALDTDSAFPMVEILSLGGTYPQLGIEPGLSCLFVFKKNKDWHAKLVAFGLVEQDCHSARPINQVLLSPSCPSSALLLERLEGLSRGRSLGMGRRQ